MTGALPTTYGGTGTTTGHIPISDINETTISEIITERFSCISDIATDEYGHITGITYKIITIDTGSEIPSVGGDEPPGVNTDPDNPESHAFIGANGGMIYTDVKLTEPMVYDFKDEDTIYVGVSDGVNNISTALKNMTYFEYYTTSGDIISLTSSMLRSGSASNMYIVVYPSAYSFVISSTSTGIIW